MTILIEIGRKTPFGNPYPVCEERTREQSMSLYRGWLKLAVAGDPMSLKGYRNVTGIQLSKNYAGVVASLGCALRGCLRCVGRWNGQWVAPHGIGGIELWCPGCKNDSCKLDWCHGSALRTWAIKLHAGGRCPCPMCRVDPVVVQKPVVKRSDRTLWEA